MANTVFANNSSTTCAAMGSYFSCNQMGNAARTVLAVGAFVLSVVLGLIDVSIISVIICAVIISIIISVIIIRRTSSPGEVHTPTFG